MISLARERRTPQMLNKTTFARLSKLNAVAINHGMGISIAEAIHGKKANEYKLSETT